MADNSAFALRYANAFATVADRVQLDPQQARQQLHDFAETLAESRPLREVLMNPSIPAEQKLAVLDGLNERLHLWRETRNFIAVVMDHQRLGELAEIVAEYDRVADQRHGVVEAEVVSAHALNDEDRRELEAQIGRMAGGEARVSYRQDGSLLGGAVVRIGSTVYDGSVKARLEQLKAALTAA